MRSFRVARAARKHKIGKAHMLAAIRNAGAPTVLEGDKLMWIGEDDRGLELVIIAVPDDHPCINSGDLTIIHAAPITYHRHGGGA